MPVPSDHEIAKLIAQILESPEFRDSARYQDLLKYLVEKSSKVTSLKETEIAQEFFGKDIKFDPSNDPLIRSYISNLRKKLEYYYLTTTNEFSFKLEIPRGHYLVKYEPIDNKNKPLRKFSKTSYIYMGVISLLLVIILYREFISYGQATTHNSQEVINPIWEDFLSSKNYPTLIILGDYLILSEKGMDSGRTFLREPTINSEKELKDSIKKNPGKYGKFEVSEVSFLGASPALGINQILKALGQSSEKVTVKLSSQVKWDDLDEHNIIYIGSLKALYKLDTLFSRSKIKYSLSPNILTVLDEKNAAKQKLELNWHGGNYQKDYSIIIKFKGLTDNSILFLTGFSEVGIMDAIKTSTDQNLIPRINNFYKQSVNTVPFQFELINETEGVKYTVFRSDIKYFRTF